MSFSIHSALPIPDGKASHLLAGDQQVTWTSAEQIPAFAGTLVQLELLLDCRPIDLDAVTRLVRSDLGLAVQALRATRLETLQSDDLWRTSDCVAHLGARLLEVVTPLTWEENSKHAYAEAQAFWKHARLVAIVAETTAEYFHYLGVNPEQAYLAGLMHNLSRLPQALNFADQSGSSAWTSDLNLPSFLNEVIETVHQDLAPNAMSELSRVAAFAHQWVELCLPWSETYMATRKRFTLPLLQAAALISQFFPEAKIDPYVPLIETLKTAMLDDLEEERPASSSVILRRSSGFQKWLDLRQGDDA